MNKNQVVSGSSAEDQARVLTAVKGVNGTTGVVHRAHRVRDTYYRMPDGGPYYQLVQDCGMGRRQRVYLSPVPDDTYVTCRRCQ